jgi:hypothetical protein
MYLQTTTRCTYNGKNNCNVAGSCIDLSFRSRRLEAAWCVASIT